MSTLHHTAQNRILQSKPGNRVDVAQLISRSCRGLVHMFDHEQKLFCYRLKQTEHGLVREGLSRRYTIMSLLGLRRLELSGQPSPIDIKASWNKLLQDTSWIDNCGDVGLLLWLGALLEPESLEQICSSPLQKNVLQSYRDARAGRTMELAWLLTGLAHAALVRRDELTGLTAKTYQLLMKNQGEYGIFGHVFQSGTVSGLMRGRFGSFADQVYPIYALARLAQAFGIDEALISARKCAEAICEHQGPLGQWWWQYDSVSGQVLQRYPVYSVHQEGMAPMALFALAEASGWDFSTRINKGLQWIAGENELKYDMRDEGGEVVWRSFFPRRKHRNYLEEVSAFLGIRGERSTPRDLTIRKECRPYELGWLLYAFASPQAGQENSLS